MNILTLSLIFFGVILIVMTLVELISCNKLKKNNFEKVPSFVNIAIMLFNVDFAKIENKYKFVATLCCITSFCMAFSIGVVCFFNKNMYLSILLGFFLLMVMLFLFYRIYITRFWSKYIIKDDEDKKEKKNKKKKTK